MRFIGLLSAILLFLSGCTDGQSWIMSPRDIQPDQYMGNERSLEVGSPQTEAVSTASGLDNETFGWGFRRQEGKAPDIPQKIIDLLERNNGRYLGDVRKKSLYLTFDEGYENGYTADILDTLKRTSTPAAFFVTGPYLERQPELIARMVEEGHVVGNHTINHPSMPSITDDEKLKWEIEELNNQFRLAYNKEMKYIRPPMGEYSERTLHISDLLGMKTIFWSSAYLDWNVKSQKGEENAFKKITSQFHNGSIILLHAVSKDNAAVLERVIKHARDLGYEFYSLDEL